MCGGGSGPNGGSGGFGRGGGSSGAMGSSNGMFGSISGGPRKRKVRHNPITCCPTNISCPISPHTDTRTPTYTHARTCPVTHVGARTHTQIRRAVYNYFARGRAARRSEDNTQSLQNDCILPKQS